MNDICNTQIVLYIIILGNLAEARIVDIHARLAVSAHWTIHVDRFADDIVDGIVARDEEVLQIILYEAGCGTADGNLLLLSHHGKAVNRAGRRQAKWSLSMGLARLVKCYDALTSQPSLWDSY